MSEEDRKRGREEDDMAEAIPAKKQELPEWEKERRRLEQWEKTGSVPKKNPLAHLGGFMDKKMELGEAEKAAKKARQVTDEMMKADRQDASENAGGRVAAPDPGQERINKLREQEKLRQEYAKMPFYKVRNACFDDAASLEYQCDSCGLTIPRAGYDDQVLALLGDSEMRQTIEGPWRGTLVRVNPRGFGFIHSPQVQDQYNRDVFVQASLVEKLAGGRGQAQELSKQGVANIRAEFTLEMGKDGKLNAKDVGRIKLMCKKCVIDRRNNKLAIHDPRSVVPARYSEAVAKPVIPGFDPKTAMRNVISGIRASMNLPDPIVEPKSRLKKLATFTGCVGGGDFGRPGAPVQMVQR